ncbi:MAG: hypothetical protein WA771_12390, partial [Chthoniobacterales bacterium]
SEAIVFGDMNNPDRRIYETRKDPRQFTMLKYLNARPRVTYLARIKNPNMAMPGAAGVGNINSPDHHGGHHGDDHGAGHGAGHGDDHGEHHLATGADHGAEHPPTPTTHGEAGAAKAPVDHH